jgi:DNA polymerase elongation subunit (family B)
MERLVFDIETVGTPWESLDPGIQESLLHSARTDEERQDVQASLCLFPVTAQIACIAMYSPEQDHAAVYFQTPGGGVEAVREEKAVFAPCTEKELLIRFWEAAGRAKQVISFNGRGFDCPFLLVRSAVNRVRPTIDLMPNRYSNQHVDLMDQFTWFGAFRRRFSLEVWCKALGVDQPKREMHGSDVAALYASGEYMKIAQYCLGDAMATAHLFDLWSKYMRYPGPEQEQTTR